jgi:hypothetical protein
MEQKIQGMTGQNSRQSEFSLILALHRIGAKQKCSPLTESGHHQMAALDPLLPFAAAESSPRQLLEWGCSTACY